jgi:glycosyltransferase involved in cell wall biosynthesis
MPSAINEDASPSMNRRELGTGDHPSPKRILYIEANEDGTVGGSHRALFDLTRHLDRSRYEPIVLFYQENEFVERLRSQAVHVLVYDEERAREVTLRTYGSKWQKALDALMSVRRRARLLQEHRIDLVHINNSPSIGCDDWLPACKLTGIPILASARGDAAGETQRWRRFLFRRFDRVVPVSDWLGDAMRRAGIPGGRIRVVHDGVDIPALRQRVRRSTSVVRSELGIADHTLLVVMVGNIRPWKGQHVLLEALGQLSPDQRSGLHVAFAGAVDERNSEYRDRLGDLETAFNLSPNVSWLGARQDAPDLFAAADLAVHCSVIPEPFGLVVAEAMALGTPVAAACSGGPSEIVLPTSGWLHDAGNPGELAAILRSVVADPQLLQARSEGALARAQDFSVDRTAEGMTEVYDHLFDE